MSTILVHWYFDLLPKQTMLSALIRQYYRSVTLLIALNMDFIWELGIYCGRTVTRGKY